MGRKQSKHYTQLPNELMESIPLYKFNGTQLSILLIVFRNTYGFHRGERELSLSFLSTASKIHPMQIKRELDALIDFNVLIVTRNANSNTGRYFKFNEVYSEWKIKKRGEESKRISLLSENAYSGVSELAYAGVSELASAGVSELAYQERKILKKDLKENIYTAAIDYLNQKLGTHYNPETEETQQLLDKLTDKGYALEDIQKVMDKKTKEWKGKTFEKYLRPQTLFGEKFESYLNQKIIHEQPLPQSNFEQRDYDFDPFKKFGSNQ